jgi:predicted DNA-binding transcriptional regulator AlpA
MNFNKNKKSHIEILLLTVIQELRNEMEEVGCEKIADLKTKISSLEERTLPELLSIKEAQEFLGVSDTTFWRMRKSALIPEYMLGAQVYFKPHEIVKSLVRTN